MNSKGFKRRSLRIPGYDYSLAGAYFLTICIHGRKYLLGEIIAEEMFLNDYGKIVVGCWNDMPNHYDNIELDDFVVMPNHVHGIIFLVGAGLKPAPAGKPLTEIVRGFKTFSSRSINRIRHTPGVPVWQRGYYEHVIRNEESLNRIREYIITNPQRWELDRENLGAKGKDDFDGWLDSFKTKPSLNDSKQQVSN